MHTGTKLNMLKQILNAEEKVYFHILAHPADLIIGKRGSLEAEYKEGIILVFGHQSYKNLQFQDSYIYVNMKFSGKWGNLRIPVHAIATVSESPVVPTICINFNISVKDNKNISGTTANIEQIEQSKNSKIVKIDFKKG